jgi:glycerate dehydrogenase
MKDGVIIINTSRGPLIVEEDLAEALNNGKVYAAGVDVVAVEPIERDNPLLKAKNIFITPHIAWAPIESRERLMNIAVENLRSYMNGIPENIVNR